MRAAFIPGCSTQAVARSARGRGVSLLMSALLAASLLAACSTGHALKPRAEPNASATSLALVEQMKNPVVDPNYIYDQLASMATHFERREAGFDSNPQGGHNAFAAYWTREMTANLQGFGPQVVRDAFQDRGWANRPATVPGVNVEVSVPGATHPEQVVIIGCHYDGEATSTESAYDDASGCAIELGVARAMASYWRAHDLVPARTLRFVIFDAEEQGLIGSYHYVNETVNGDLANIVAMINEEQNGINYPLRYLGYASNPLIPYVIDLNQGQENADTRAFEALTRRAIGETFAQFRALGMRTVDYRTSDGKPITRQIFTPDQTSNVLIKNGDLAGSDEYPFLTRGVTQATFGSDGDTYPFDVPQDTIALMNIFASGGSHKAQALVYALAIPAGLTTWMLNQPEVLGATPSRSSTFAAISDVGQTVAGQPLTLDARAAYDPARPDAALSYSWDFGDGATASGVSVSHTYATTGAYTITLRVQGSNGSATVRKPIQVESAAVIAENPFPQNLFSGAPRLAPEKLVPTPDPRIDQSAAGAVGGAPEAATPLGFPAILMLALALLLVAGGGTFWLRRRQLALSGSLRARPLSAEELARQRRKDALRALANQQLSERANRERDNLR